MWVPVAPGGVTLRIARVELWMVSLPLLRPFRSARETVTAKQALLVAVGSSGGCTGWGECAAGPAPGYSEEWLPSARRCISELLVPMIVAGGPLNHPDQVGERMDAVRGNRMAKAAVEAAVMDAWLQEGGVSLSTWLGGVRATVECGVSVGSPPAGEPAEVELVEEAGAYLAQGYRRVKAKLLPGSEGSVMGALRRAFPDAALQADANGSYGMDQLDLLAEVDEFGLEMVEQPLAPELLVQHAALAARLGTPICLDESIRCVADVETAAALGAARVINVKPGRMGGILEARRTASVAATLGMSAWVGGMLETGVGRAVNLAVASVPDIDLPGDTSASDRYFAEDLTEPFTLRRDGTIALPHGPGCGRPPLKTRLHATSLWHERIGLRAG
ncbi:MAG: o-succinylbenzoate synthase [Actinomycetota bacterium]|nr:o-succinylbenzoate synthase [Actinomycetota bacterium]